MTIGNKCPPGAFALIVCAFVIDLNITRFIVGICLGIFRIRAGKCYILIKRILSAQRTDLSLVCSGTIMIIMNIFKYVTAELTIGSSKIQLAKRIAEVKPLIAGCIIIQTCNTRFIWYITITGIANAIIGIAKIPTTSFQRRLKLIAKS